MKKKTVKHESTDAVETGPSNPNSELVKKPTLTGQPKPSKTDFEQHGTNNIKSVDIGAEEAAKK